MVGQISGHRHRRGSGGPGPAPGWNKGTSAAATRLWIPAFAGMMMLRALRVLLGTAALAPALADEEPKYGDSLTYMIPADAPPSFDGHRESTYATVHSVAPFYSVLIRADPENPSDTTHFVCDVCTAMPEYQPRSAPAAVRTSAIWTGRHSRGDRPRRWP